MSVKITRRTLIASTAAGAALAMARGAEGTAAPIGEDAAGVQALARELGFIIPDDEAPVYARHLARQRQGVADFLAADVPQSRPVIRYPDRHPGHRATAQEDPHHAWLWRSHITGAAKGLLHGKTVSFKDHVAVAGLPVSYGARELESIIPDFDATIVARCLDAGATILGKNALDGIEGGHAYGGRYGDYPRPLNPHDPACVSGGSSSGSAVAVALGEVDIAFGGDQGGSVRNPASYCGVIGLKPSHGLVSRFGVSFGMDPSIDYVGPIARHSIDIAAALQAVAGTDGLDPFQGRRVPDAIDVMSGIDGGVRGLRIGLLVEGFHAQVDPAVVARVEAAAALLAAHGAEISRISVPEHATAGRAIAGLIVGGNRVMEEAGWFGAFGQTYYPPQIVAAIARFQRDRAGDMPSSTKLMRMLALTSRRDHGGAVYAKAQNARRHFVDAYDAALDKVDLLLMPTTPTVAMRVIDPPSDGLAALEMELDPSCNPMKGLSDRLRNVQPFNYTGHPAISVPCGKVGGLPAGMQFVGRFFDEARLLRVAFSYEHMVDWTTQIAISRGGNG